MSYGSKADMAEMISLYIGGLAIRVRADVLHDAAIDEWPPMRDGLKQTRMGRLLLTSAKPVIAMALSVAAWHIEQHPERGLESPDIRCPEAKHDLLDYAVNYVITQMLRQLSRIEWDTRYVEHPDGSIEITGLAAAATGTGADQATTRLESDGRDGGPASASAAQITGPDQDSAVGTMAGSGSTGDRQDDILPGADSADAVTVAGDASLYPG